MKRSPFTRVWCVLALLPAISPAARGAERPAARTPVYCPALRAEDRSRTNAFTDGELPQPTLVVLGTVRWLEKRRAEIRVEKALFGSAPGRKFRAVESLNHHGRAAGRRRIFVLAPTSDAWSDVDRKRFRYELLHSLPAGEEKAVAAVSAARLDYNALAAEIIFVGKELSADVKKGRAVRVVRVLHGPGSLRGNKVRVKLTRYPVRRDRKPVLAKEEMLYFVASVEAGHGKRSFRPTRKPAGPVYRTSYRLPVAQEKKVRAALGRREQYPLVEIEKGGNKVKVREVLFRGTVAEAVELLDSESEGAVVLGGRFLIHHQKEARKAVLKAVKKDLLRTERDDGFQRLHHLISLLPRVLPPQTRQQDLERLVEKWLAHLASNPPPPPAVQWDEKRQQWPTYFYHEERSTYRNHSLAWLLAQLPEERAFRLYGKRLLEMREKVAAGWKREVQLALDVADVEDRLELAAALPRLRDIRPVRSQAALRHPGGGNDGALAFSPDGKYLATAGGGRVKFLEGDSDVRVWHTRDWSPACKPIPQTNSVQKLLFSPDGRFLYVLGGSGRPYLHARFDWRTGKLDRAYEGPREAGLFDDMELSADGKVMVTSNTSENVILVRDTHTGKVLKTLPTGDIVAQFALSPDGKTLLRQKARVSGEKDDEWDWGVEALGQGSRKVPAAVFRDRPSQFRFTPDGRLLLGLVERRKAATRRIRLYVWDVKHGFRKTASVAVGSRWDRIALEPTGRVVVVIQDRRKDILLDYDAQLVKARVFSLPTLKLLKQFAIPEKDEENDVKSIRFSPDGKLLAIGLEHRPTPFLFRTDTYEPVIPFKGHGERIVGVFFPPGGKVVRTLGYDNTVCTWDRRTLQLLRRQGLPPGWVHQNAREPDGRYLLGTTGTGKKGRTLAVFDLEADRVVATVKISRDSADSLPIFWVNDREVYALDGRELCHFDVKNDKILDRRKLQTWLPRRALLTEGGKDFLVVVGNAMSPVSGLDRVSAQTGKATRVGEVRLRRFFGNKRGVVPGGQFFYIADPGFYLFDSKSMKRITSRAFRGTDVLNLAFTRDGRRFAVVVGGRISIDFSVRDGLRAWDPGTKTVVRIHDTRTCRTLGFFPASTHWVSVKFSPGGKQLAVINDDGTFELWDLSALDRP
jgi:WD40 repeat protein